jgi:NAD(P)-dependent dehydrogenase (short-subunit alcohol dehydrogenase family)
MDLKGQAAIITGGGSGLGFATASLLAAGGCKVALLDINDTAAKERAAALGGIGVRCDVADAASAEAAMAEARAAHGPARILVNCAGVGTAGRVVGREGPLKLEAFDRVVRHQSDRDVQHDPPGGGGNERPRPAGGQ